LAEQTVKLLDSKKEELAFLVRVKMVELFADLPQGSEGWANAEIDGVNIRIDVT